MRWVKIKRSPSSDEGTFGELTTDNGFTCKTGELPDRGNKQDISCIPPGKYPARWYASGRPSMSGRPCYHVDDVPGRFGIEIHPANLMGDKEVGFSKQVEGCIALGVSIGLFQEGEQIGHVLPPLSRCQRGMTLSKQATAAFEEAMRDSNGQQENFELTIE